VQNIIKRLGYAGILQVYDEDRGRLMSVDPDFVANQQDKKNVPVEEKTSWGGEIISEVLEKTSPNNKSYNKVYKDIIITQGQSNKSFRVRKEPEPNLEPIPTNELTTLTPNKLMALGTAKAFRDSFPEPMRECLKAQYRDQELLQEGYTKLYNDLLGKDPNIPANARWNYTYFFNCMKGYIYEWSIRNTRGRKGIEAERARALAYGGR
jgi:hypothetical protein